MAFETNIFPVDDAKVRWYETYTSGGLNRKAMAESQGVVRGFEFASAASATQFTLEADAAKGDNIAVLFSATGFAVTFTIDGDITVNLGAVPVAPGAYWVALWYQYNTGGPQDQPRVVLLTTAETLAVPYAGNIVILGWVNYDGVTVLDPHPVAGTPNLGLTNYTFVTGGSPDHVREIARNLESKGRVPWQKMVRFGRADEYIDRHAAAGKILEEWKMAQPAFLAAGEGFMEIDDTDPYKGDLHFTVNAKSDTAGAPDVYLFHKSLTHVREGDAIRFGLAYKVPAPLAVGNWSIGYGIMYLDRDGNLISVVGSAANLLALGVGGAATAWTEIETLVHVIGNRNIEYAMPFIRVFHTDDSGGDVLFYFDEIECEVLPGNGPEKDVEVDALDHPMQPTKTSVLSITDFIWDAVTPTQAIPVAWDVRASDKIVGPETGRSLKIRRIAGPAGPPHPLVEIENAYTGIKSQTGPSGTTTKHRQALFEQNTPRAWATLTWNGANLAYVDSYGFNTAVAIGHPGGGRFVLTFEDDEDGNEWIQDSNYSVTFGVVTPAGIVGPTNDLVLPSVVTKTVGPPSTMEIKTWRLVAGSFSEVDPSIVGIQIMIQVFAAD